MNETKPMTVGELRKILKKYHPEAVVKLRCLCMYEDGTGSFEDRQITNVDSDFNLIPTIPTEKENSVSIWGEYTEEPIS